MKASLGSTLVLLLAAGAPAVSAYRSAAPIELPESPPRDAGSSVWQAAEVAGVRNNWGPPHRLQSVIFASPEVAIAGAPQNRLWRSIDGGASWRPIKSPMPVVIGMARFPNGTLLIGGPGKIARSTDSGASWQEVRTGTAQALVSVGIVDSTTAVVVGERVVLRTTDGGLSWSKVDAPEFAYYRIRFASPQLGLAVGAGGVVLRSRDAGVTWEVHLLDSRVMLRDVAFLGGQRVIAVGSRGTILRSDDGGLTWQRVRSGTTQTLRAVAFADERHGVIAGFSGTILRTEDGGRSWTPEPSGTLAHFFDATIAPDGTPVVVGWGNTILRRRSPISDSAKVKAAG